MGNIARGEEAQTQAIIDAGALGALLPFLGAESPEARKEACWLISNVTAGSQAQMQAVIDANLVQILCG